MWGVEKGEGEEAAEGGDGFEHGEAHGGVEACTFFMRDFPPSFSTRFFLWWGAPRPQWQDDDFIKNVLVQYALNNAL